MFDNIEKIEDLDSLGIYPVKCIFRYLKKYDYYGLDDNAVFELAMAGDDILNELSKCIKRLTGKYKAAEPSNDENLGRPSAPRRTERPENRRS